MFDEPKDLRLGQYQQEHTQRWSSVVDRADAFAFVHKEYNHGMKAALKNALGYLNAESALSPWVSSATAACRAGPAPCRCSRK